MGVFLVEALERWSGKQSLPVDRSLVFPSQRSPMESWSCAPTHDDRARFAACLNAVSQVATESWSSALQREDRTRFAAFNVSPSRIAESLSSARKRGDRTRQAIVDIRLRRVVAESWSSVPRHEDRTRIAVAGTMRGSWVGQGGRAAIAVSVVGLALLFAAPIAMADSGASGGQAAATGTTTTADPQGQTSGTSGGAQPSGSTSSQLVSGSGASSAPGQTSGSGPSGGQGTVADTSTHA